MNTVMIIPTGIGCEIGGHAGDATPSARLLGSVSDKLILHPNVVNASDINEMPENSLYVEGSILDRFLEDKIRLKEAKQNKILVVVNFPIMAETVNAVNAARVTLGIDAEILELSTPLRMVGKRKNGKATGDVYGYKELAKQISKYHFDALAIATPIEVSKEVSLAYFKNGGINPWGGVEAKASKLIASIINKPVAHAPVQSDYDREMDSSGGWDFVCDPRMSPEIISKCFLHCVLKGLNKAPRISNNLNDLSVDDIDVLVSPYGCWGRPHCACREKGKKIIIVKENTTILNDSYPPGNDLIFVENYFEAAGKIVALKEGINLESINRPMQPVIIGRNI